MVFKGSSTVKNSYKYSVYRGLRRKENEKRKKKRKRIVEV